MSEVTITLNDESKLDELLYLLTALPYVESASLGVAGEKATGLHGPTGVTADDKVDEELSPFYHDPRTDRLDREIIAFETMKADLLAHYLGEYVAIFQGAVIDHDLDKAALLNRLAQSYPDEVVLVRQVRRTPRPPFRLRSPRLSRN
ncbi:MAG: hypothetical protein R3C14_18925 [Caldilineaceae bacterium]